MNNMAVLLSELQALRAASLASSGVDSCDVPFRYGNQNPAVARWHSHLRDLAAASHKISGPAQWPLLLSRWLREILGTGPHILEVDSEPRSVASSPEISLPIPAGGNRHGIFLGSGGIQDSRQVEIQKDDK